MTTFGKRLKQARQLKELSQEDFGKILGLTKQSISRVENDKIFVSKEILCNMIVNFNLNINYLLTGKGQMFLPEIEESATSKTEIALEVEKILKEKGLIL